MRGALLAAEAGAVSWAWPMVEAPGVLPLLLGVSTTRSPSLPVVAGDLKNSCRDRGGWNVRVQTFMHLHRLSHTPCLPHTHNWHLQGHIMLLRHLSQLGSQRGRVQDQVAGPVGV